MKNSKRVATIFLLGPQGCGKGTQAKLLAKKYGLTIIEMGAILRAEAARRPATPRSRRIADGIGKGKLLPSEIVLDILRETFRRIPQNKGILIDGAPRKLPEARHILHMLAHRGRTVTHTFFINISRRESVKRLLGRKRADDTPAAIRERLSEYHTKTKPVLQFLRSKTPYFRINGEQGIPAVFRSVDAAYRKGLR